MYGNCIFTWSLQVTSTLTHSTAAAPPARRRVPPAACRARKKSITPRHMQSNMSSTLSNNSSASRNATDIDLEVVYALPNGLEIQRVRMNVPKNHTKLSVIVATACEFVGISKASLPRVVATFPFLGRQTMESLRDFMVRHLRYQEGPVRITLQVLGL